MAKGSCACGKIVIEVDAQPSSKILCHCTDCQKFTSSTYSTNMIIPGDKIKIVQGTPKQYKTTADSGKEIVTYFCGDCGTNFYRESATFGTNKVLKVGVMDEEGWLKGDKPAVELYNKSKVNWVNPIEGADQKEAMP